MLKLQGGIRKIDKLFNHSHEPAQTKQQVGQCVVATFWCTNEPQADTNSKGSPRFELGESHHLPPYSKLCAWPQD